VLNQQLSVYLLFQSLRSLWQIISVYSRPFAVKNGSTLDNFGKTWAHFGNVSAQFINTKTPQIPVFSSITNFFLKKIKSVVIHVNLRTKKMTNKPNLKSDNRRKSLPLKPLASSLRSAPFTNKPKTNPIDRLLLPTAYRLLPCQIFPKYWWISGAFMSIKCWISRIIKRLCVKYKRFLDNLALSF
jgi:hypothetical protein